MSRGFFIPSNLSAEYVQNKRTPEGEYQYDKELGNIKLERQASLQSLSQQYNTTIDSAYANYLMANRGIRGSTLGQGYKEAYIQETQASLQRDITETNLGMQNVRAQVGQQASAQIADMMSRIGTETGNMNRVAESLQGYFDYLKEATINTESSIYAEKLRLAEEEMAKLPKKQRTEVAVDLGYFSDIESKKSLDDMYEQLLNASPKDYYDASGDTALGFMDWVYQNIKDNERDRTWADWLINQGGINQFRDMVLNKGVKKLP